jgi:hypothetical protein
MTLHEHFRAQFAAEGGQWHTDKEVDRAMRALFSDSNAGALAREQILQPGVWPRQLGPMISKAAQIGRARLMEMCQLKEGADQIVHPALRATLPPPPNGGLAGTTASSSSGGRTPCSTAHSDRRHSAFRPRTHTPSVKGGRARRAVRRAMLSTSECPCKPERASATSHTRCGAASTVAGGQRNVGTEPIKHDRCRPQQDTRALAPPTHTHGKPRAEHLRSRIQRRHKHAHSTWESQRMDMHSTSFGGGETQCSTKRWRQRQGWRRQQQVLQRSAASEHHAQHRARTQREQRTQRHGRRAMRRRRRLSKHAWRRPTRR